MHKSVNFRTNDFLTPFFADSLRSLLIRKNFQMYTEDIPYIAMVLADFSLARNFNFKQADTLWMITDSKGKSVRITDINIDPSAFREVADSYIVRTTFSPHSYYLKNQDLLQRVGWIYYQLSRGVKDQWLKKTFYSLSFNIYFWKDALPDLSEFISPAIIVSRR